MPDFKRNSPGGCNTPGCICGGGGGTVPPVTTGCKCPSTPGTLSISVSAINLDKYPFAEAGPEYWHTQMDWWLGDFELTYSGSAPAGYRAGGAAWYGPIVTRPYGDTGTSRDIYYVVGCYGPSVGYAGYQVAAVVRSTGATTWPSWTGQADSFTPGGPVYDWTTLMDAANSCNPWSWTVGARSTGWYATSPDIYKVTLSAGGLPPPMAMPMARESPGMLGKAGSFARSALAHVAGGLAIVPDDVADSRRAACLSCPHHEAAGDSCRVCGCNLAIKRSWATEACPVGLWPAHNPEGDD